MENYMDIANHWTIWIAAFPLALLTLVPAILYARRAFKIREEVGLSRNEAVKAFRVGATASIGPAFGVFVIMLGLMTALGAPFSWMRLTTIGSAPIQLSAAEMAAEAMGTTLGGEGYEAVHFASAAWVLSLNGMTWLLVTGLFADKMDTIQTKVAGGDPKKIGVIGGAAMVGAFAYLFTNEFYTGIETGDNGYVVSLFAAGISMYLLNILAKKFPKLNELNLGIAMIIGMAAGVFYNRVIV